MQFHDTAGKAFILYKTDDTSCTRVLVTCPVTTQYPLTHTHTPLYSSLTTTQSREELPATTTFIERF